MTLKTLKMSKSNTSQAKMRVLLRRTRKSPRKRSQLSRFCHLLLVISRLLEPMAGKLLATSNVRESNMTKTVWQVLRASESTQQKSPNYGPN